MDVGMSLSDGWKVFVRDIGALIVAGLIAVILTGITIGILGGPLYAGLTAMILGRVRDGKPPRIGDVFSRFDRFGAYLVAFYLLAIGIAVGLVLLVVPGLYLGAIWFYVFPLMVDRGLGVGDALRESRQMANANKLGSHMLTVLVLGIISFVASGLVGLGFRDSNFALGTVVEGIILPFTLAVIVAAYARVLGYGHLIEAVGRQER